MKSYTDIEQSKVLANILPPESADYCWGIDDETLHYNNSPYPCAWKDYTCKEYYIPCWSLASLLSILPEYNLQRTDWENKTEYKIVVNVNDDNYASKNYDNPVDACVAMIEKLHELNLL